MTTIIYLSSRSPSSLKLAYEANLKNNFLTNTAPRSYNFFKLNLIIFNNNYFLFTKNHNFLLPCKLNLMCKDSQVWATLKKIIFPFLLLKKILLDDTLVIDFRKRAAPPPHKNIISHKFFLYNNITSINFFIYFIFSWIKILLHFQSISDTNWQKNDH